MNFVGPGENHDDLSLAQLRHRVFLLTLEYAAARLGSVVRMYRSGHDDAARAEFEAVMLSLMISPGEK